MNEGAICKEVIITRLLRRGTGKDSRSPIRIITQIFEKDGTLLCENDPYVECFTMKDMAEFVKWCLPRGIEPHNVNEDLVKHWVTQK